MKVICINTGNHRYLTMGKMYECEFDYEQISKCVLIIDDGGVCDFYSKSYFITIEEYRNKKLEKIGI